MPYYHNLLVLLQGIFHARVRGGRIKRFIIFVMSFAVIIGSIWLMFNWSFIHTSKHIIYLSHPMAVDTARNHYMKVDIHIKSTEGYTVNERDFNPPVYEHTMTITQLHQDKPQNTSLPPSHDIRSLNYYLQDSIIIHDDSLDSELIPINDIGNLIVFAHYYNCDFTETNENKPFHILVHETDDEEGHKYSNALHSFIFDNDSLGLAVPLGAQFHKKLADGNVMFPGKYFYEWFYCISPNDEEVVSFCKKSTTRKKYAWLKDLLKLHDISRHYYEFYIFTQSIDEVNLTFQTNEMAEFSHPFTDAQISENSISTQIHGDHFSSINGIGGCSAVYFYTRNLESENAQLVRMFLLMTFCAFALGFFLKSLSEYFWIIIRKIQKTKSR